ncbi:MAG: hypothetical protein WBB28_01385 [Crinalium sp.]
MPNISLYPLDFNLSQREVGGREVSLEAAIAETERQDRDVALRQAHARRIAGQNEIANQNNSDIQTSQLLMPTHRIGRRVTSSFTLGTAAYLGGGRGEGGSSGYIDQFKFSSETITEMGIRLITARFYTGTIGNAESGKFVGGTNINNGFYSRGIDKIDYAKQSIQQVGMLLDIPRVSPAGGMGTASTGLLAGGLLETTRLSTRDCIVYDHVSDTHSITANSLTEDKCAPHNGLSSKVNGYVCSGSRLLWSGPLIFSYEEIPYYGAAYIANIVGTSIVSNLISASFTNDIRGYRAGGYDDVTEGFFGRVITGFSYDTKIPLTISTTLNTKKTCADGTGDNINGFVVGGDTVTPWSDWKGIREIERFRYGDESIAIIGAKLTHERADQGAVADYGPGFSY